MRSKYLDDLNLKRKIECRWTYIAATVATQAAAITCRNSEQDKVDEWGANDTDL